MEHVKNEKKFQKNLPGHWKIYIRIRQHGVKILKNPKTGTEAVFLQRNACGRCRKSEKGTEFLQ